MLISFLFAIITVVGESYKKLDSWDLIIEEPIRACILVIIYTIIYYFIKKIIKKLYYKVKLKEENENKITYFIFEKHPFIIPMILILVVWLPVLIIKYPGTPGWDFYYMLNKYYGFDGVLTQTYPLPYVFFCMQFIKFGIIINNNNIGLFLLTLVHFFIMLFSFSLVFVYLKKWKVKFKIRYLILFFYSFNILFSNYATTIYHDVIYSSCVLIYTLLLTDVFLEKFKINKFKILAILLISLCICFTRKNGIYIILPINIILIINCIKHKYYYSIIGLLIPIIIFYIFEGIFSINYYKFNLVEALAIPLQTISRYSKEFHDDITEEEKWSIGYLVNYDISREYYNPRIVDPVRNNLGNYNSSTEEKICALKTWIKLFFRHPSSYIQAFINNTYNLYYPFENSTYIFNKVKDVESYNTIINFSEPEQLKEYKEKLSTITNKIEEIPLICYLDDPGIYIWMFIILTIVVIKKRKNLIILLPGIITIIICIFGPTIYLNTRYVFSIIFSIFPLIAFYVREENNLFI